MSNMRDMIDAIENDEIDQARDVLKITLAEYIGGKKYLSNQDVYGSEYTNPNEEEQRLKAELTGE